MTVEQTTFFLSKDSSLPEFHIIFELEVELPNVFYIDAVFLFDLAVRVFVYSEVVLLVDIDLCIFVGSISSV